MRSSAPPHMYMKTHRDSQEHKLAYAFESGYFLRDCSVNTAGTHVYYCRERLNRRLSISMAAYSVFLSVRLPACLPVCLSVYLSACHVVDSVLDYAGDDHSPFISDTGSNLILDP